MGLEFLLILPIGIIAISIVICICCLDVCIDDKIGHAGFRRLNREKS